MVVASNSVEITLIVWFTVLRSCDQIYLGSVDSDPITKNVMMNSSNERAKVKQEAAIMIGQT